MTPLEINKKIAELKGIKNYEMDCKIQGMPVFSGFPNWAESILAAFELFEEMAIKTIFYNMLWFNDAWRVGYVDSDGNNDTQAVSETAPMAICLAYIAWKEDGSHTPETKE